MVTREIESVTAPSILKQGLETLEQRAKLRDSPSGERSMGLTVAIFNAWTGNNLSEQDGYRFMIALKQAREAQGQFHSDDYVDGANYFALLGESEGSRGLTNPEPTAQRVG